MAIIFTTGTINQPDAGSVGLAMAEKIRDDVVAHAAWELVEEFTPAASVMRWYVFRCLATESGLPADFFAVMGRRLSDGTLYFTICESYNAVGHLMSFYPVFSANGVTYDSEGRSPATYTLGATAFPASGSVNPKYLWWTPAGTSTKWWLTVAEDGFTVAFNGAANAYVHLGAYIPLAALPIVMPIQIIGSSVGDGGITRNPAVAGWPSSLTNSALLIGQGPGLGFQGDLRYNDKLQSNQRPIAEMGMFIASGVGGDQAQLGWALGKHKRMRVAASATPIGFAFGDAYALNGRLWVPYLPTNNNIWDTGVASS